MHLAKYSEYLFYSSRFNEVLLVLILLELRMYLMRVVWLHNLEQKTFILAQPIKKLSCFTPFAFSV
jgi:hypothetical protein